MSDTIQTLTDFLHTAEKNRKYPVNSIYGIKAALRLFSQELKDEEKESFDTFKDHFEQIYQSVFHKNKATVAVASLETYKRRISGLLKDYEKYGTDPTKMANWERPVRKVNTRKKSAESSSESQEARQDNVSRSVSLDKGTPMHRLELSLRPNVKAIILVPSDLTKDEGEQIKGLIEYLSMKKKA